MKMPTRFDITVNKNMRKKADRKALSFINFCKDTYVGDGIVHLLFKVDQKEIVFLDDHLNAKWLVSECNDFIVGSGVINKIYRSSVHTNT